MNTIQYYFLSPEAAASICKRTIRMLCCLIVLWSVMLSSGMAEEQQIDGDQIARSWRERQQDYLDRHFGVTPIDYSRMHFPPPEDEREPHVQTVEPAISAQNIKAEMDRYTSVPPGINYYAEVARKLGDEPEFLAVEPRIRQILYDLGGFMLRREWTHIANYQEHITIEQEHFDETWSILSRWWVRNFLPNMTRDQARDLLWENLTARRPEVPLHSTVGEQKQIWAQHLGADDRDHLHELLLEKANRHDLGHWHWLLTIPGLEPPSSYIDNLLAADNDSRHQLALRHLISQDPYDPRGPKTLLNDERLDVATVSTFLVDYMRARGDDPAAQQELLEAYLRYLESTTKITALLDEGAMAGLLLYRVLAEAIPRIPQQAYVDSPQHREIMQQLVAALSKGTGPMKNRSPFSFYFRDSQRYQQMLDDLTQSP